MDHRPDVHEYCTGGYKPEDIVISGIAGRFPECDNVGELKEAMFNKKKLILHSDKRYEKGACGLPYSSYGLISDLDKLDADFFCVAYPTANGIDPASRKLLEVSYEAIADSGYDPFYLRGMNIGVYNATISDDAHQISIETKETDLNTFLRCMIPNRTSYANDFIGPSYAMDTGCSSSACALWAAVKDLQEDRIEAAVVNGAQIDLDPRITAAYIKHGVQSLTGNNIPFDANTDGIMRTEAAVALFLQKASVARRCYGIIASTRFVGSGHVPEGITVPSMQKQIQMSHQILKDAGITTDDIDFMEAHGTGTYVGDPIELNAISAVYCENRKRPFYLGSIKSFIGHPEASSGACGIVKALIALETGTFPPNLRYNTPNTACQALVDGKLRVVTEPMPLTTPYIPVNSFGFGGTLVQVLLKQNPIEYSKKSSSPKRLPRLVLYPATTEEAIETMFDYIEKTPDLREEFFALMHKLSFTPTSYKPIRGARLFREGREPITQINTCPPDKRPVYFIMTGMGCQWPGMGRELMEIEVFAKSMKASAAVLKGFGLDLFDILNPEKNLLETRRNIVPAFVSIASIQIALIDVLRSLGVEPDGIVGHSTGELVCAYADGCCTAEESLKSAYWRGKCTESANLAEGAMAAVGLTWKEATKRCPEGVYPACENADDSVTISGLKENVENFVEQLKKDNVFARVVNAYGYAFHCPCIAPASTLLRDALKKILINPKPRTSKWITSSHPESDWEKPICKMAGAEYFVNNLITKVRFNEAVKKIPKNALLIEIGPQPVLLSVVKRSIGPSASYVSLMKRDEDNLSYFMEALGKIYTEGADPNIERLYPSVKFPVPRGTPTISDLIRWDHSQSFHVARWSPTSGESHQEFKLDKKDSYLMDHKIDGRSLFPATGYIFLAWEALATKLQKKMETVPVKIQNFRIHRATIISNQASVTFFVNVLGASGSFEITEGNSLVASGEVQEWRNASFPESPPSYECDRDNSISGADVYNELKMSGYEYGTSFQRIMEIAMDGTQGLVTWEDKWIPFLDSLLLFFGLINKSSDFCLPTGALSFKIDPTVFYEGIKSEDILSKGVPVHFNPNTNLCRTVGIEIAQLSMDPAPRRANEQPPTLEEYKFIPYVDFYAPEKDPSHQLLNYLQACNKTIDKIGKGLGIKVGDFKFKIGTTNSLNFSEYMETLSEDQQLLKILKEISLNPNIAKKGRKEVFASYLQNFGKEMLNCRMTKEYPLRILTEIISENSFRKLDVIEVNNGLVPVLPSIMDITKRYSYIKFKSSMLVCTKDSEISQEVLDDHNIQKCPSDILKTLKGGNRPDLLISSYYVEEQDELDAFVRSLATIVKPNGFIMLFSKDNTSPPENLLCSLFNESLKIPTGENLEKLLLKRNFVILSKLSDDFGGSVYLIRSPPLSVAPHTILKITETDTYDWVEKVKSFLSKNENETLWLVTEDDPSSGIIGMVNCLKQEPGGEKIRCAFMFDKSKDLPAFSFEHSLYKELLEKNLVMNVWKNGTWGSFRHVLMKDSIPLRTVEHSYVNCRKYGDLSSFEWMESHVKYASVTDEKLVHIYYSALNFKDVMLATGKLSIGTTKTGDSQADDSVLGLEFSGRDKSGRRVAGFIQSRGMATSTLANPLMCIDIPSNWTMEEAATVPVVYATCYYALVLRARLRRGESILIHSGTGGIGLAAISIAMSMQCEIFTTVGNELKRKYLKEKYPEIKDENIGCSRDTTFEAMIQERTKGKGVNVVLNSLADDKFQASLRCVSRHGRFIEIGKYDLSLDRKIGLKIFLNNITVCGVFLDQLFDNTPEAKSTLAEVMQMVKDGIKDKVVKPLDRTIFSRKEIEEAFRYMAKGVHVGKVLIKVREEESGNLPPKTLAIPAVPKTYFYSSKVYIVIGGLGGFGIEITKWILSRGGKNIILTSRFGARTPYHHWCLKRWKKAGYNVQVSTLNVCRVNEAEKLLKDAALIGPVGGIFNSAVILKDAFMDCQTAKSYDDVCAPKATATKLLDELSRLLCPALDYFVCFSSVSCGRGNAGQTNYGYANSVMERICELRRSKGLHGLAIQWGIIGEVGVVHRHMGDDAMIAGVSAQSVKSCLEAFDTFCQVKHPVVSSYVNAASAKKSNQIDVLTRISKILGMNDISEVNTARNFGEMGIDSMVGVEVKQLIENTCDVSLTMQEIFDMKINDIRALVEKAESDNAANSQGPALVSTTSLKVPHPLIHKEPIIALNKKDKGLPIFIISIGDSDISDFHTLAEVVNQPTFAVVWTKDTPALDLKGLAEWYLQLIENNTHSPYHLVGYSLGGSLALEMALQSEKSNKRVNTISLLDGSAYLRRTINREKTNIEPEVTALCEFVEQFSNEVIPNLEDQLLKAKDLEQRTGLILDFIMSSSDQSLNKSEVSDAINNYLQKSKTVASFATKEKLKKDIALIEDPTKILANDITELKNLFSQICSGKVNIHRIFSHDELSNTEAMKKIASTLNNVH